MDAKSFYGARQRTLLALVPEIPEDSDADLSDNDDPIEDPDYHPTPAEVAGDSPFESLEEEAPSTSSSTTQPPLKKSRKGKSALKQFPWRRRGIPLTQVRPQVQTKEKRSSSGSMKTLRDLRLRFQDLNPLRLYRHHSSTSKGFSLMR